VYTGFTVANCIANVACIERGNRYKFYAEGVTPAVAGLHEAINAERVAVAAALGACAPTGLIPMSELGAVAAVRTPAIDALIELARNLTGKDFAAEARTLDRLGLGGMDVLQIQRVVEEGFR
jgi:hypothetical protein